MPTPVRRRTVARRRKTSGFDVKLCWAVVTPLGHHHCQKMWTQAREAGLGFKATRSPSPHLLGWALGPDGDCFVGNREMQALSLPIKGVTIFEVPRCPRIPRALMRAFCIMSQGGGGRDRPAPVGAHRGWLRTVTSLTAWKCSDSGKPAETG